MTEERRFYVLMIDKKGKHHVQKGSNSKGFSHQDAKKLYEQLLEEKQGEFSEVRTMLIENYKKMGYE